MQITTKPILSFKGDYDPKPAEINKINQALAGDGNNPDFFVSTQLENALVNYLNGHNMPQDRFNELDGQKTRITNFYNQVSTDKAPVQDCKESTERYLKELRSSIGKVEETLEGVGLGVQDINFFKRFVAKTSPIMYYMGFPDEVAHPAQVARLCAMKAKGMGATNTDILKSACVGWMHDPKFKSEYGWANLATHPIIAGCIADKVLTELNAPEDFKTGVQEALFVNNDSKFVLDNAILGRPPFPTKDPERGLAYMTANGITLREVAHQRFEAPSRGIKPLKLPKPIREQLQSVDYDTGIRKIDENTGKVSKIKTSALPLFCHHEEVSEAGKIPAKALVIADPSLLSLHKIITSGQPGVITSFLNSLNDNIRAMPCDYHKYGEKLKKNVLISCITAANELNSKETTEDYPNCDIEKIEARYLHPETWGKYKVLLTGYDKDLAQEASDTLKKHYEKMADHNIFVL